MEFGLYFLGADIIFVSEHGLLCLSRPVVSIHEGAELPEAFQPCHPRPSVLEILDVAHYYRRDRRMKRSMIRSTYDIWKKIRGRERWGGLIETPQGR